jgi:hypothetical protein
MINIIISIDPSTKFLFDIITYFDSQNISMNIIEIHPTDKSYSDAKESITNIPKSSIVLFLGHGQSNQLYGGESSSFEKKSFISSNEMNLFEGQNLFVLACDSTDLLKGSFRSSKTSKSIGFGGLPTEMKEVESDKKLSAEGITQGVINQFKSSITETVSEAFLYAIKQEEVDYNVLKDYLCLLINKRINKAVLEEDNRLLGDLLYKMKNEIMIY